MKILELVEYDHAVSFHVERPDGMRFFVQYRRARQDENGVWQLGRDESLPDRVGPLPPAAPVAVSADLMQSLDVAITAFDGAG